MSKIPKMIRTAPESVYLIVDPNGYSCVMSDEFPRDTGEVSWCEDSCGGIEVKYVRDDLSKNTQSWAAAFQVKDRCEQIDARIAELTAEMDRYKDALITIHHSTHDELAEKIARDALKEG